MRTTAPTPVELPSLADRPDADVVIFDPETINGLATFPDPFHYSVGMKYVFVNGVAVVSEGDYTDELPGRALRGPAYEP